MSKKYYTPTIEEFHVGFEYEYQPPISNDWYKNTWEQLDEFYSDIYGSQEDFVPLPDCSNIRVKYLDREDIESFGFVDQEDRGMSEYSGYLFQKEDSTVEFGTFTVRYWIRVNRMKIDAIIPGTIFDGVIKNKSEFKRLLIQLNIIQ